MERLEIIVKCWRWLSVQFYKPTALLVSWLVILMVVVRTFSFLSQFRYFDGILSPSSSAGPYCYAVAILLGDLAVYIVWRTKRSLPKIKKGMIGILFAPSHTDDIHGELKDLSVRLTSSIKSRDIPGVISVRTLPPNVEVGEHVKNVNVLAKANAVVLICGNFERFTANAKRITGFSSLTITARSLPVKPQETGPLLNDAITGRQFAWDSENTIHKNVVVDNLTELARYIIGLSLISQLRFDDARLILTSLLLDVQQKYNSRRLPLEIVRFKNTIRNAMVVSLVRGVSGKYCKQLMDENVFNLDNDVFANWEAELAEALRLDRNNFEAFLVLAIVKFLRNDIKGAKEAVRQAGTYGPSDMRPHCLLSEAFLLCFEGNLPKARKLYRSLIMKTPPDPKVMTNVFSFLSQAIEEYLDKPQLRFAYALLNDEFGDKTIATDEFQTFLSNTSNDGVFDRWRKEASIRVSKNTPAAN